mmetsp:Transcript_80998/g.217345  ORF Transcript_80998/g.217345 Transcript_80998/m.217345 type:complete len:89 (-) Transcript_80998:2722-2988(-)
MTVSMSRLARSCFNGFGFLGYYTQAHSMDSLSSLGLLPAPPRLQRQVNSARPPWHLVPWSKGQILWLLEIVDGSPDGDLVGVVVVWLV